MTPRRSGDRRRSSSSGRLLDTLSRLDWRGTTPPRPWLSSASPSSACAVRWRVRARRHARMLRGAVTVTVVPPPRVDPAGAVVFWSNLLGLLRPALVRGWRGQPHLVFEYGFTPDGVAVSVWVPGGVAAGLVARAVTAAWPGSRTTLTPTPTTPQPPRGDGAGSATASGPDRGGGGWAAAAGPRRRAAPGHRPRPGWTRSGRCWPRPARCGRGSGCGCRSWPARSAPPDWPAPPAPAPGRRGGRMVGAVTTAAAGGDSARCWTWPCPGPRRPHLPTRCSATGSGRRGRGCWRSPKTAPRSARPAAAATKPSSATPPPPPDRHSRRRRRGRLTVAA